MKKTMRILAAVLAAVLMVAMFAACSKTETPDNQTTNDQGQTEAKIYKIGISQFAEHPSLDNCRNGFIEGLKQEGFEEGVNVTFDYQNSQADTNIANQIAQNFASGNTDLICAIATISAQAAYNAAEAKKIPVIYSAVSDPVKAKLVGEDGKSGLTVTGTSDDLPVAKQLAMIREFLPNAKKIGILYTLSEVNSESQIAKFKALAPEYGFEIVESGITTTADISLALDSMVTKVDCINNLTDNTVVTALATVLDKANAAKIPVFGSEIEQVKSGCIASESIDYYALGIQTGKLAARVLKGEDITTIPFEVIKDSAVVANKTAMESLGITMPAAYESTVEYVNQETSK